MTPMTPKLHDSGSHEEPANDVPAEPPLGLIAPPGPNSNNGSDKEPFSTGDPDHNGSATPGGLPPETVETILAWFDQVAVPYRRATDRLQVARKWVRDAGRALELAECEADDAKHVAWAADLEEAGREPCIGFHTDESKDPRHAPDAADRSVGHAHWWCSVCNLDLRRARNEENDAEVDFKEWQEHLLRTLSYLDPDLFEFGD